MNEQQSVLIIDDDIGIRDGLSVLLGKYFITGTASSGKEALDILNKSNYDIYIIDIFLGDLSGFEILKEIKSKNPKSIAIMLTGFGSDEDIELAKKLGADEFLHKPINFSNLKKIIDDIKSKKKPSIKINPLASSLLKIIKNTNHEILKETNLLNQNIQNLINKYPEIKEDFNKLKKNTSQIKFKLNFIDYYIAFKNKTFVDEKIEVNIKNIIAKAIFKFENFDIQTRIIVDDKRAYLFFKSFELLSDILIVFIKKYNKSLLRIKKTTNGIEIELINASLNIQKLLENNNYENFPSLEIMLLKEILNYMNARFNIKQEGPYTNLMILIPLI